MAIENDEIKNICVESNNKFRYLNAKCDNSCYKYEGISVDCEILNEKLEELSFKYKILWNWCIEFSNGKYEEFNNICLKFYTDQEPNDLCDISMFQSFTEEYNGFCYAYAKWHEFKNAYEEQFYNKLRELNDTAMFNNFENGYDTFCIAYVKWMECKIVRENFRKKLYDFKFILDTLWSKFLKFENRYKEFCSAYEKWNDVLTKRMEDDDMLFLEHDKWLEGYNKWLEKYNRCVEDYNILKNKYMKWTDQYQKWTTKSDLKQ